MLSCLSLVRETLHSGISILFKRRATVTSSAFLADDIPIPKIHTGNLVTYPVSSLPPFPKKNGSPHVRAPQLSANIVR